MVWNIRWEETSHLIFFRREPAAPAGSRTSVLNVQVLEDEQNKTLSQNGTGFFIWS